METIVIYSSKTGFTKQYASWIASELECDAVSIHKVTTEEREQVPFFYFQSGINYENMNLGGRLILKLLSFMIGKKKNKTKEDEGMVQILRASSDNSNLKYIIPLVKHVRREAL